MPSSKSKPRVLAPALILAVLVPQMGWAAPGDVDADGIPDANDAYPCDYRRAAVRFAPAEHETGTLLYEDNWPLRGDLDFNDAVLAYHHAFFSDAQGRATGARITITPRALGANIPSGIGLRLPVSAAGVQSATLRVGAGAPADLVATADGAGVVFVLSANMRALFDDTAGIINAEPSLARLGDAAPITFEIDFAPTTLPIDPVDLFLFRSADPSHEIHRPQFAGTQQMNQSLFGTGDDGSTTARRFVDAGGLPFLLDIPAQVTWPRERAAIDSLWPNIVAFAASGGASARDFYLTNVATPRAYGSVASLTAPGGAFDACFAGCPASFHLDGTSCVADSRACAGDNGTGLERWAGGVWSGCALNACNSGFHFDTGVCVVSTRACAVTNGTGTQTYEGGAWGACQATACAAGFHVESGACAADLRACAVPNGTGTQSYASGGWSACVLSACSSGYHAESGSCASNTRSCSVANGTGTQTYANSAWGTCALASCNGGYHVEGGACTSNARSCSVANGTGTQSWTGSTYGACTAASCSAGYHVEAGACASNTRACTTSSGPGLQSWAMGAWGACLPTSCAGIADGAGCDDGDACTSGEICRAGACVGPSASSFNVLEAGATTFAANAWTSPLWTSSRMSSGIAASGRSIYFGSTGVYRVTLAFRGGSGDDVWTAARLYGAGSVRGLSAGTGITTSDSPHPFLFTFLASVENTSLPYEVQLGRAGAPLGTINTIAIAGQTIPAVQATLQKIGELPGTSDDRYAVLNGNVQTFAANAWTSASWASSPLANGVTVNGTNISFASPGTYRVTLSWRWGSGSDNTTGIRLLGGGVVAGTSPSFSSSGTHPNLFTSSFLAVVRNTGVTYNLQMGRVNASQVLDAVPINIVGTTPAALQATLQKVGEVPGEGTPLQAFASLHGPGQTFAANAWTSVAFDRAPAAQGVTFQGSELRFPRAGTYRVTLSYRFGTGGDDWTAVRLHDGAVTRGISSGFGAFTHSPNLVTSSFLARVVDPSIAHRIQVGRRTAAQEVAASSSAVVGTALPAVQATIEEVRTFGCSDGRICTADLCDAATGCHNPVLPQGTTCETGDYCTGETCLADTCVPSGAPTGAASCDDANPCTAELCSSTSGCSSTAVANGTSCDDGSAFTSGDTCQLGVCAGATSGAHGVFEAGVTTFGANAWTSPSWTSTRFNSGVSASGANLTFASAGVYRISMTWRFGAGGDNWTAVRLFGAGAVRGTSAGFGNVAGTNPSPTEVSFLARIDDPSATYQIQVGRVTTSLSMNATPLTIVDTLAPALQATVTRVSGLDAATANTYAQLEGPAMTFAANAWTPVGFTAAPVARGVALAGSNLTFDRTGVYRVTLSWRYGVGGDVWTAVRLFGGARVAGLSAGFGGSSSSNLFTASFLASVTDATVPYAIQVGRLGAANTIDQNPAAIAGTTPAAVQATVERVGDVAPAASSRAYASLEGNVQTFASGQWTGINFASASLSQGIGVAGRAVTFPRAGLYRISVSYRFGFGGDVWTALRLSGESVTGVSAAVGNIVNTPNLVTISFVARVTNPSRAYEIQMGRHSDVNTLNVVPLSIVGSTPSAIQASIEEL